MRMAAVEATIAWSRGLAFPKTVAVQASEGTRQMMDHLPSLPPIFKPSHDKSRRQWSVCRSNLRLADQVKRPKGTG